MAKLFGNEYHEHSNSWYFKSNIRHLKNGDLEYKKYQDENGNYLFRFSVVLGTNIIFPPFLEILYNKVKRKIIHHECAECGVEECKHYLTVLNYAYNYLTTDILDQKSVKTYQSSLLNYNEFWQRIVLNARIEISDIYNIKTNKIRFHLKSYNPMNIRLASLIAAGSEIKEDDYQYLAKVKEEMEALSSTEKQLLALLQKYKCSFSRIGNFFTIYRNKFPRFMGVLANLSSKVYIKETGDRLKFSEEEFKINFLVLKIDNDNYLLKVSNREAISTAFVSSTTYILMQNIVHQIHLPFNTDVQVNIFREGYHLKKADLVYLSSVVARQLGLLKCYLDFSEDIEIPEVLHNTPKITFNLRKENNSVIVTGLLDYSINHAIPMAAVQYPAELVKYDIGADETWFYIPPQIKYQVNKFLRRLPEATSRKMNEKSELTFEGDKNIEKLKKVIFEYALPEWNINLSDELKQEFVYRVELLPEIATQKSDKINWFEYKITYHYGDISFSHQELKQFFDTREKFLKLEDGRLLFFENKTAFNEVDKLLAKSKKTVSDGYKLSIYNLPYIYQLSTIYEGIKVAGDDYLQNMYKAIITRKLENRTQLPEFLKPIMRSYQKSGFHWIKMLEAFGISGILADDMGLGKTLQAISVLTSLPADSKSIVICPKTLLFNWAAEIEKFNRNLSYVLYEGNQKERKQILKNFNVNIMFASYSIIQNDIELLAKIEFDYIILDEAQHIKNSITNRAKAVKKLNGRHKLCLSGTPIENNLGELWSIFDFLMPGYLPTLSTFKKKYMIEGEEMKSAQLRLKMLISPFILRRKKSEVLLELPDKQEQIIYCKLSGIQEKLYLQVLENVKLKLLDEFGNISQSYMHILAALTRLRQICNHPALVEKTFSRKPDISGKLELLKEIIEEAVANDKKLLIFSQFVQMLKIMKTMLDESGIPHEYMDGSTKDRQKVINNFNNNNNIRAFLISLKTGGYGLNLTAADTVIIVDPWWNPMGENQAIDRAYRIGQTKKVMVYKLIAKGSIEEKIMTLQKSKRELFENLIEDGQSVIKSMNVEQLKQLLEY